ncbi:MAG: hypothetical protein WC756_03845 [Taibaiella sp.]|jgi:hypothetical protein
MKTVKQLTKKEAIALGKSGAWKTWSDEQIVKVQLFQKRHCVGLSRFSAALSNVLQRPVLLHEIGANHDGIVKEYLGINPAPTLDEIINLIPQRRRFLIWL